MQNRWSDQEAGESVARYGTQSGEDLALRTYSSRLLGAEPDLVLHGGGNTSVKSTVANILGESLPVIYVKASGFDLASIEPEGHPGVDLQYLRKLGRLADLSDEQMMREFRAHLLDPRSATPSLETLVHALIPAKFIDHTHADAILALTNQVDGERHVREALGDEVAVLAYAEPGFQLARVAVEAFDAHPRARGMVWMLHGLVTWGETARESYQAMIELVSRAERYVARQASRRLEVVTTSTVSAATERLTAVAPIVRGLLAQPSGNPDRPHRRVIVRPLINEEVLAFVGSDDGRALALSAPLTSDHLIRTRAFPLWVDDPSFDDLVRLRTQVTEAVRRYEAEYRTYVGRHAAHMPSDLAAFDGLPRVVLMPGLGALCAGKDVEAATIAHDITEHTLRVKARVAAMGTYQALSEHQLFKMEYRAFQQAKIADAGVVPLGGQVGLITGAAGAIGAGICRSLLQQGCHVAATDLPGERLDSLVNELRATFGSRIIGVPLDVTDQRSVADAFAAVICTWGGVDLLIVNAGIAHVASLAEMELEAFRRLERVNVEGTLLVLAEAGRHFSCQATGGDIIVVSTKNVFAPGARFGAYSASKAASHQLARIASLEMAEIDVRVNMVAPDAVFSDGARKSGLWAEVGPDRMRARGLDESGLEEYYRSRNLLKARVTATHVANAVLYFATRQSPTTGATIPVDGGLPDATPR